MSTHGCLPAHIRCRSSVQFRHSRITCRTVWGPYLHWHWSVSTLLMAWRYARKPILPVRICVMTELIALCVPICVGSVPFPGRTPILKSSLPCLAVSQAASHSSFIVWRMIGFVVAIRVLSDSGSDCGSGSTSAIMRQKIAGIDDMDSPDRVRVLGIIDQFRELGINEDISLPQVKTPRWALDVS